MALPGSELSLLYDLFVANQHLRRLYAASLAGAGLLRADEYAVYSLLLERGPLTATEMSVRSGLPLTTVLDYLRSMEARGHLRRDRHPRDGRAQHLSLTLAGVAAQRTTNAAWERMRIRLEAGLQVSPVAVREALAALGEAARAALAQLEGDSAAG